MRCSTMRRPPTKILEDDYAADEEIRRQRDQLDELSKVYRDSLSKERDIFHLRLGDWPGWVVLLVLLIDPKLLWSLINRTSS